MVVRQKSVVPPARGLSVDVLESTGGEFVVIGWDVAVPASAEASLTKSERVVLTLLTDGLSNAAIAQKRKSSPRTVANQVASLLRKLGASSRFELMQRYGRSRRGRA